VGQGDSMASTVSVSIIFTDLVDSTLTGSRLGPEAAEAFRQDGDYFGNLGLSWQSELAIN
jgi:hypothetical protein